VNDRPRAASGRSRDAVIFLQKLILVLTRVWPILANLVSGTILGLAFLAPALMAAGMTGDGQVVYRFLAPHDHQLPQRSYFLFGQAGLVRSYSLQQVLAYGADPDNLRAFSGNPQIGFKMALNQRMVAIFVAIFLGGLGWVLARGHPRPGPFVFILLTLPLLIDGFSHLASETSGRGFRDSNAWAVALTGGLLPGSFYEGTMIGSLNWLLRTTTGLLFGLGLVWFLFTYLSNNFAGIRHRLEPRLRRIGAIK
jgi:uncharacterized membrane protein